MERRENMESRNAVFTGCTCFLHHDMLCLFTVDREMWFERYGIVLPPSFPVVQVKMGCECTMKRDELCVSHLQPVLSSHTCLRVMMHDVFSARGQPTTRSSARPS